MGLRDFGVRDVVVGGLSGFGMSKGLGFRMNGEEMGFAEN